MQGDKIKLYKLVRNKDVNGISGTGVVAMIAVMPSGRALMEWIASNHVTITIFNNLDEITLIHGHDGSSIVKCLDESEEKEKK